MTTNGKHRSRDEANEAPRERLLTGAAEPDEGHAEPEAECVPIADEPAPSPRLPAYVRHT